MEFGRQHKGTSFAPFLEELERLRATRQETKTDPLKLLALLKEAGPVSMVDLMAKSGLPFNEFADTITTMEQSGLVSVTGLPGKETIQLTQSGTQLSHLAR